MLTTTHHEAGNCPHCGNKVAAATGIEPGTVPVPGDIGICAGCGGWIEYGEGLSVSLPTVSEFEILLNMDAETRSKVIRVREAIIKHKR